MTREHIEANIASWVDIGRFIEEYPDSSWAKWKTMARRFVKFALDRNFNRHFRAGQSMSTLVFSTLDHHGLRHDACVSVSLRPPDTIHLSYAPSIPAVKGDSELTYELPYDEAVVTFQRFLNHLWEMTVDEPLPSDMRSPEMPFNAPIMPPESNKQNKPELTNPLPPRI